MPDPRGDQQGQEQLARHCPQLFSATDLPQQQGQKSLPGHGENQLLSSGLCLCSQKHQMIWGPTEQKG